MSNYIELGLLSSLRMLVVMCKGVKTTLSPCNDTYPTLTQREEEEDAHQSGMACAWRLL